MPELMSDLMPVNMSHEVSPVPRITTRIKDWLHRHTPEGRKNEYLTKWNHVMEGVNGLPRFELEKRLNDEAKKYARDRVVRDVLVAAAATAGAGVGIASIVALKNPERIQRLFTDLGAKVTGWATEKVSNAASEATKASLKGALKAITKNPDLVGDLAHVATEHAATGVQQAAGSTDVQAKLELAGFDAAGAVIDGATIAVQAHAAGAPDSVKATFLRGIANFLGRVSGDPGPSKK